VLAEESEHVCIELLVEDHAIEIRSVVAEFGSGLRLFRGTGRQKGEVPSIWRDMVIGFCGQVSIDSRHPLECYAVTSERRAPELNRDNYILQPFWTEEKAGSGISQDGGLDARIVG
jgi:hypothetical protein